MCPVRVYLEPPAGNNWDVQANWEKTGNDAGNYPGHMVGTDIAVFSGLVSTDPATVNIALPNSLNAIQIESGYTGTITLQNNLVVTGNNSSMANGTITGTSFFGSTTTPSLIGVGDV